MNPIAFQHKWLANTTKERSAAQSHFNDLCELVNHPKPLDIDGPGEFFTFERGASKLRGGEGWADVWYKGRFAVEYKGRGKDLKAAYDQLAQYREDLENPPLLIVSDLNRIEIHTNFTGTVKHVHAIDLSTITEPESVEILRKAFFDPDALKPEVTIEEVTEEAARQVGLIAAALRARGAAPLEAAHYLMQLLFCLFAEDIGILRNRIFSRVLEFGAQYPARFNEQVEALLTAMAEGGFFNLEAIPHVNGGLFRTVRAFPLEATEIRSMAQAARLDWSSIEPAIFGTLFERSLDPARRAQLGAHYTSRTDIERVVEPVVMTPLRREWEAVRLEMDAQRADAEAAPTARTRRNAQERLAATQGRIPRPAGGGDGAGPGLRQRKFPVRGAGAAAGAGEGSDPARGGGRADDPPAAGGADAAAGDGAGPAGAGAGPGGDLDRVFAVDDPATGSAGRSLSWKRWRRSASRTR